jgi:UDP-N-acetylmuramyl pentapeptide phosphotransferase/UDP-N-acetylglucosamine-1-phosphate transferase
MFQGEWCMVQNYLPFMVGLVLICGVSFIDDVRSLPDSVRLVAQFVAMILMFYQLDMLHADLWWAVIIALIVCVGASNIINFMDGINGITGAYAMASLIPLYLINSANGLSAQGVSGFVDESLIITVMLADLVFCYFNFRPRDKAKCFAGDVGSLVVAFILLFMISGLVMATGDVTYLIFLLVYCVDGVLTIFHRIMLHENLGQAHRKHVFQLMANELKMSHITVSLIYAGLQLAISLGFIYLCPNTIVAHWIYLVVAGLVLAVAYVLFMRKYYYLHEQYLKSLEK